MITRVDSTFDMIDINIDLKEAEAILRAIYVGMDNVPGDRRIIVDELRAALLAFLYPTAPNTSEPEETL